MLCLWRGTYANLCPNNALASETKTPFYTGNQASIELGVEGEMPASFREAILMKNCTLGILADEDWEF